MGTQTDYYNLFKPAINDEDWGGPVAENFSKTDLALHVIAQALIDEVTNRNAAISAAVNAQAVKLAVRVVATANITAAGLITVDGIGLGDGNAVLLTAQTNPVENGIFVAQSGTWLRRSDADSSGELNPGTSVWVNEGTTNADSFWELKSDAAIIPGTTTQVWQAVLGPPAGLATAAGLSAVIAQVAANTASIAAISSSVPLVRTTNGVVTVAYNDAIVANTNAAPFTQPLPPPASGRAPIRIKNGGSNGLSVSAPTGFIDSTGTTFVTIPPGDSRTIISDGTNFYQV